MRIPVGNYSQYRPRIISKELAAQMQKDGYYAIDMHCHTAFSYDVPDVKETSPYSLITAQKRANLHQVITDHDNINAISSLRKHHPINTKNGIIAGAEITIKPLLARKIDFKPPLHTLHINVFGINKGQLEDIEEIAQKQRDLDALIAYFKSEDLAWMYNHPFWKASHERLNWRAIPGLAKNYFDVIELNATISRGYNNLAFHIAQQFNKGIVAASDTHIGIPGVAFTIAEGKDFASFWENVKERKMYVVRRDMTTLNVVKESSAMISNIFRANTYTRPGRRYTPAIGIKPIDSIAEAVTTGKLRNQHIIKRIMQLLFHTLNYSAGPIIAWRLSVRKENNDADSIHQRILRITSRIKRFDETKNSPNNTRFFGIKQPAKEIIRKH